MQPCNSCSQVGSHVIDTLVNLCYLPICREQEGEKSDSTAGGSLSFLGVGYWHSVKCMQTGNHLIANFASIGDLHTWHLNRLEILILYHLLPAFTALPRCESCFQLLHTPVAPARHVHGSRVVHIRQTQPMHRHPSPTAIQSNGCRAAAHHQKLLATASPLKLPTDGRLGSQMQQTPQGRRAVFA